MTLAESNKPKPDQNPAIKERQIQDPAPETGEPIDRTPREDPLSD